MKNFLGVVNEALTRLGSPGLRKKNDSLKMIKCHRHDSFYIHGCGGCAREKKLIEDKMLEATKEKEGDPAK